MNNSAQTRRLRGATVARRRIGIREQSYGPLHRVVPRDGYRLALWVLVLLSISRIHQHLGPLAAIRPALLTALAALGFAVMNPSILCFANLKTRPAKYMIALVIMACISVPFGISIGSSGKYLLDNYFRVVLAYVLLTLALGNGRNLSQFTWVWVIACAILSWLATFVFVLTSQGGSARLAQLYMYDSNDMGVILVTGVPLALAAIEMSKRGGRIAAIGILLWMGLAIARSGSRGAFVSLLVLIPAFLLMARHIAIRKRVLAIGALAGVLMIAAPFGYWEQMQTLMNPTDDYNWTSETGRKAIVIRGFGYMKDHPVTGLGINNFSKAEWTLSDMAADQFRQAGIKGSAAHNTWLQAGAEMGVPGLILWLVFVFGTMAAVMRQRARLPDSWRQGDPDQRVMFALATYLPLSILGFALTSTFVSFAYIDPMYYLAAMSAGLLTSIRRKRIHLAGAPARIRAG